MGSTHVGRYVLERRLAVGGMAEVFLARIAGPKGFEKRVVVKRILEKHRANADFVTMFLDEARLAARFNHPNLISVYELTEIQGQYYLAMEYLEGADLETVLDRCDAQRRHLPANLAAFVIAEAAAGLHYAHRLRDEKGAALHVVHRDISPNNLVATWHGVVKVVDFGIAKHAAKELQTAAGIIKGKFAYLSPEQVAAGQSIDQRSDVFALGSVLYELLTLSRCYQRSTPFDTLRAISHGEFIPANEVREGVPDELLEIMARAMRTKPDDRYPTADALSRDLRRFMARGSMPSVNDLADFLHSLLDEKTEISRRVFAAVGDDGIPVGEDLAGPEMAISDVALDRLRARTKVQRPPPPRRSRTLRVERMADPTPRSVDRDTGETASDTAKTTVAARAVHRDVVPTMAERRDTVPSGSADARGKGEGLFGGAFDAAVDQTLPVRLDEPATGSADAATQIVHTAANLRWARLSLGRRSLAFAGVFVAAATTALVVTVGSRRDEADVAAQTARETAVAPLPGAALPVPGAEEPSPEQTGGGRVGPPPTKGPIPEPVTGPHPGAETHAGERSPGMTAVETTAAEPAALAGEALAPAKTATPGAKPQAEESGPSPSTRRSLRPKAKLTVGCSPGCAVTIDGRPAGSSPATALVTAGNHVVRCVQERFGLAKRISVRTDGRRRREAQCRFAKGKVQIWTEPWAEIWYGGKKIDVSPGSVELWEGKQVLELFNPETNRRKRVPVTVEPGRTVKVAVHL